MAAGARRSRRSRPAPRARIAPRPNLAAPVPTATHPERRPQSSVTRRIAEDQAAIDAAKTERICHDATDCTPLILAQHAGAEFGIERAHVQASRHQVMLDAQACN